MFVSSSNEMNSCLLKVVLSLHVIHCNHEMYNLKGINPYVNVKLHWVDLHKAIVVENGLTH